MDENKRLEANTAPEVNQRIAREAKQRVVQSATKNEAALTGRIEELESEWDADRALIAIAGFNVLLGLTLGTQVNRKWLLFPAVVGSFLLFHAVRGWCPPFVVLRRKDVRTRDEINAEKFALKALRGDFDEVAGKSGGNAVARAETAWEAAQA